VTTIGAERLTTPVRVIATVSESMNRFLLDDFDLAVDFIGGQLRYAVQQAEEDEILNGSGSGFHLTGILNAGIQSQAKETDRVPTAILKATSSTYARRTAPGYSARRRTTSGPQLWGMKVIVTTAITEGAGLLGNFAYGSTTYEREGARLSFAETGLGESAGEEMFTRNQLRWRCESRIGFAVHYVNSFAKFTGI
jgi:hypothetical protein